MNSSLVAAPNPDSVKISRYLVEQHIADVQKDLRKRLQG